MDHTVGGTSRRVTRARIQPQAMEMEIFGKDKVHAQDTKHVNFSQVRTSRMTLLSKCFAGPR